MGLELGKLIFHPELTKSELVDEEHEKLLSLSVVCEFYAYPFMEKCQLTIQRSILANTWNLKHLLFWNKQKEHYESVLGCYSPLLHHAVIEQTLSSLRKVEQKGA